MCIEYGLATEKKLHVGVKLQPGTKKGRGPSCVSRVYLQLGQKNYMSEVELQLGTKKGRPHLCVEGGLATRTEISWVQLRIERKLKLLSSTANLKGNRKKQQQVIEHASSSSTTHFK